MATLSITGYSQIGWVSKNSNQHIPYPNGDAVTEEQIVTISGTSTQCAALNANTTIVELCSDTACYLKFGTNPTAVHLYHYLPAGQARIYGISNNQLIAVIN